MAAVVPHIQAEMYAMGALDAEEASAERQVMQMKMEAAEVGPCKGSQ